MRILASIVLIVSMTVTCAPTPNSRAVRVQTSPRPSPKIFAASPCEDSLFAALKTRPLESMTEREYQYFIRKDEACNDYQKLRMQTETQVEPQKEAVKTAKDATTAYIFISIIGVVVSLLVLSSY